MKRLFACLLSLALSFGCVSPVFATEDVEVEDTVLEETMDTEKEEELDETITEEVVEEEEIEEEIEEEEEEIEVENAGTTSGSCGTGVYWNYSNSTLEIYGNGAVKDYSSFSQTPWYGYRSSIKTLKVQKGVTRVGRYTFSGASALTTLYFYDKNTAVSDYAFDYFSTKTVYSYLKSDPDKKFVPRRNIKYYLDEDESKVIESGRYGDNVTYTLTVGGTFTYKGTGPTHTGSWGSISTATPGYWYKHLIKTVIVSPGITALGSCLFMGCTNLTTVYMPSTVTRIDQECFEGCTRLRDVYYMGTSSQKNSVSVYSYNSAYNNATFHYPETSSTYTMYRLYNRSSGEHLFTKDVSEINTLCPYGWIFEGRAWDCPKSSSVKVYRLYNPHSGDHHYTKDYSEYQSLKNHGWRQEGVAFYAYTSGTAVYRLFNSHAKTGTHHYTTSYDEYQLLKKYGWTQEGIAWYC